MTSAIANVLLIDDSPFGRSAIEDTLARINGIAVNVNHVDDLQCGYAALVEEHFDIVFLEHVAPELALQKSYEHIHAISPGTLIVVFADFPHGPIASEVTPHTPFDYIFKGQMKEEVIEQAILKALDRRQLLAELESEKEKSEQARRRVEKLIESNADGIVVLDQDGVLLFANPAALELLGYSAEELLGEMVGFPILVGESQEVNLVASKGGARTAEMRITVIDWEGETAYVASLRDITERKVAEDKLQLAARIMEDVAEGVMVTDATGVILSVNPAFTEITGYTFDDLIGQTPRLLRSDRHDADFYERLWQCLLRDGRWQGDIWNRRKGGAAYLQKTHISAIRAEDGLIQQYAALISDVTEQRKTEGEITFQAYHDALTGLPNRTLFLDRVGTSLAKVGRGKSKCGLLFIDLDNFKLVNDTLGHATGDLLLKGFANRLVSCLREGDTVSRLSGDEFSVLLEEIEGEEDAVAAARKVIESLAEPYLLEGHDVTVTVSIGLAIAPRDGDDPQLLLRHADMAMYHAKERGKNQFQLFDNAMHERTQQRIALEADIRQAIKREDFSVYYQPKVSLASGKIISAEALVRWTPPDGPVILPGEFIPVAEKSGLIEPLGAWVLRRACEDIQALVKSGEADITLSVNLSARQLEKPEVVDHVRNVIRETGIEPSRLCLEVTETAIMHDTETAIEHLLALKNIGVSLSLDDFGVGYSSLSYLRRFPVDEIKIDQSFVRNIPADPHDSAIAATIVSLAHYLDLRVVAEGIENESQLEFFRSTGCHEIQGYIISKPLRYDAFVRLLQAGPTL